MNEDRNYKIKIIILFLLLIILIILAVVLGYKKMLNDKSSDLIINSAKEDLQLVQASNEISNNIQTENSKEKDESNSKYGVAKIETPITMNNTKFNVEAKMSFVDWEYSLEAVFREKIDISINGKNIDSFQIYAWTQSGTLNYQMPEIRLLTDATNNREYLMIVANNYIPSYGTAVIKVYDENGKIIADLDDWGRTEVKLKENETTIPRYRIYTDSIRIIEPLSNGGASMHEYTIKDGKLEDEIIEEYSSNEIEQIKND